MYDDATGERCQVRQMSLLDELGQVSHLFSDKTGTLTSNQMEFRRVFVSGTAFGAGDTAISGRGPASPDALKEQTLPSFAGTRHGHDRFVNFLEASGAASFFDALVQADGRGADCRHLLVAFAINHSVAIEMVGGVPELAASSPDEQAFVAAAEHFGLEFVRRDVLNGMLHIIDKRSGEEHQVELLETFAYETSRKCMSVVVRLPPELVELCGGGGPVRLYCKGADSAVLPKLLSPDAEPAQALEATLNQWAALALRTLVWAYREIPRAEWEAWHNGYHLTKADPVETTRFKAGLSNEISRMQLELEKGLRLLGGSAVEDKLQDGVPEILRDLRIAGMSIWMLTGDKVGTAKNIAAACSMLPRGAEVIELTADTFPGLAQLTAADMYVAQQRLEFTQTARAGVRPGCAPSGRRWWTSSAQKGQSDVDMAHRALEVECSRLDDKYPALAEVRRTLSEKATAVARRRGSGKGKSSTHDGDVCLVIDERAIDYCVLACREALVSVSLGCAAVVACRARKDQKAQLLQLVKDGVTGSCCLAIGDGANDVAMIKAAHIGVGIIGKEGMQAVNNSDFAIGQFRYLRGLLLVHGRWAYRRMCVFAHFMFYKNVVLIFTMYLYSLTAMASPIMFLPSFYYENYSTFFTSLPILVYGFHDEDVPKRESAHNPALYTPGIRREYFTTRSFWLWMGEGVLTAVVATFLPILAMGGSGHANHRAEADLPCLSFMSMTITCICTNLRLAIEVHSWSVLEHIAIWLMFITFELLCLAMAYYYPTGMLAEFPYTAWGRFYNTLPQLYSLPLFWLAMMLAVAVTLLTPRVHVMGRKLARSSARVQPEPNAAPLSRKQG